MFPYYGGKSKIVQYYPPPKYDVIIEPFAGSGRYSLRYWDRHVWLNDRSTLIARIWRWLQQATASDIQNLPELKRGDDLRRIRYLCHVGVGVASPRHIASEWATDGRFRRNKRRLLQNIDKIRHWRITCKDYRKIPNQEATWFVDPPYQYGGHVYPRHKMNYTALAWWCRGAKGQVLVCENNLADWLPFRPLAKLYGQRKTSIECLYTNGSGV